MITLTQDQVDDLRELQQLCDELRTELVIIGAIAYQHNFPHEERQTGDIDIAVGLDLDDFAELEKRLQARGWSHTQNLEHRWRSTRRTLMDLIPAGSKLRKAKQVVWPESQFAMSLVGFDHVFSQARPVQFADGLTIRIIPAVVLMLLKIVAFMDDQHKREKDLSDIRAMFALYEIDGDRIFSELVLEARLQDISLAGAFLLGVDVRSLCTLEELVVVHQFLAVLGDEAKPAWPAFVRAAHYSKQNDAEARVELAAFAEGLDIGGGPTAAIGREKQTPAPRQNSVFERLSLLAKEGARIRVNPLTPTPPENDFKIIGIDRGKDVLITEKLSSQERVYLPSSQIDVVLHTGPDALDLIQLKGRLQWMTLAERWEARPEKPDSGWGIAKRSGDTDPRVAEIQRELHAKGYRVGWANEDRVSTVHGAEREIIYDSDGCYFRKRDRPFDQILVRTPNRQ